MHLQEQERENETITSESGDKWCGISGKEGKGFSNWKPVCFDDDLLLEREFYRYAAVATSHCCCWVFCCCCLFVCLFVFILNSPWRFLCLARLFSFKTPLCSNGFQHGLRAILSQHPAPISIFIISLLCWTDLHTQFRLWCHERCLAHGGCSIHFLWGNQKYIRSDSGCCCSGAKSRPTLCGPMDCSRSRFLSLTISQNLCKFMSIESVIASNHLSFYCPLLLLPSIFPNIRVFSNELVVCIKQPNYWSFSFWQCTGL